MSYQIKRDFSGYYDIYRGDEHVGQIVGVAATMGSKAYTHWLVEWDDHSTSDYAATLAEAKQLVQS